MRVRVAISMLPLLASALAVTPTEAGTTAPGERALVSAAGATLNLKGDITTLASPAALGPSRAIGTAWRSFDVTSPSGVPAHGVAAVVLDGVVSGANGAGTLLTRPSGSASSGAPLLEYRPSGGRGLTVVKVGRQGGVQVRSTGGTPAASLRVIAWLPETTSFRVPEIPARTSAQIGTATRTISLAGVPREAGSVVVQLTRSAKRPGILHSWGADEARPLQGLAFKKGTSSVIDVASVGRAGTIRLRASRKVGVAVRVLAWSPRTGSLTARPDRVLASVKPGGKRVVALAGTGGVPASSQHVWASVTAPAGARVRIWRDATGTGKPVHDWHTNGATTSVLLPVPRTAGTAMRVTGTKAASRLVVHGIDLDAAGQQLMLKLRAGTHLLGWGDVVSFQGSSLVLAPTADRVATGNHLQLRDRAGLPHTLRVTSTASSASGGQSVQVVAASLSDAFADFRIRYGSDSGPTLPRGMSARQARARIGAPSLGLPLGSGSWSCSAGGSAPAFDLEFSGTPHLDVSLSAGTFDFSLKGQLTSSVQWSGGQVMSCTYDGSFVQIPLGTTPVALKLGPTSTFSFNPHGEEATVSATSTQRFYTSVYYAGGEPIIGKALDANATSQAALGRGTAQLDLGLKVAVGPASHGELELGPEVSATLGASYLLAPPDPADDPYGRHLAGPRCTDITNTLFLSLGAALLVPFLPDVSLDVARFDTSPVTLHRGPCVGYEGTISYHVKGSNVAGAQSCSQTPEPCSDWEHSVVKTLAPGPASFPGGVTVLQPYAWTWSGQDRYLAKNWLGGIDGHWNGLCTAVHSSSGVGSVGWGTEAAYPGPEGWTVPTVFSGGTNVSHQLQAEMAVGHGRGTRTTTTTDFDLDDGFDCGEDAVADAQIPAHHMVTSEAGGAEMWRQAINVVAHGNAAPPNVATATFNLSRREYARQ